MSPPPPYSVLIMERLIPKLEKGIEKGRIELSAEDCERFLFVLRTSVPLEPFLMVFSQLINETMCEFQNNTERSQDEKV